MVHDETALEKMSSYAPRENVMDLHLPFGTSVVSGIGPTEIQQTDNTDAGSGRIIRAERHVSRDILETCLMDDVRRQNRSQSRCC